MGEEKGNFKRYMKTVKQNQTEMLTKNKISKIKTLFDEINNKLDRIEKRMNELEDRPVEMISTETEKIGNERIESQ